MQLPQLSQSSVRSFGVNNQHHQQVFAKQLGGNFLTPNPVDPLGPIPGPIPGGPTPFPGPIPFPPIPRCIPICREVCIPPFGPCFTICRRICF